MYAVERSGKPKKGKLKGNGPKLFIAFQAVHVTHVTFVTIKYSTLNVLKATSLPSISTERGTTRPLDI